MPTPFGGSPYSPGREDQYDYSQGSRISDLIMRAGDIQARRAQEQGAIWGQTVAGLGQMAGGAIQDYQAQKAAEAKARLEHEQKAQLGGLVSRAQDPQAEIQDLLADVPDELKPQAFEVISKVKTAQSEGAKRRREAEEHDAYGMAVAADALDQVLGTPLEGIARKKLFGLFADSNPEQVAQLEGLPAEQLRPLLQNFKAGSNKWQEEQAKIEKERAETAAKLAEPGFKEREFQEKQRATNLQAETTRRGQDLNAAQAAASLAETRRGHDLTAKASAESNKPLSGEAAGRLGYSVTAVKLADELVKEFSDQASGVEKYRAAYKANLGIGGDTNLDRKVEDLIDAGARARTGASAPEGEMKTKKAQIYRHLDAYRGDTAGAVEAIQRIAGEMTTIQEGIDPTGAHRKRAAAASAARSYLSTDENAGDPL